LKAFSRSALVNKAQVATDSEASKIQWMIVPRHPQRFDEVAELIASQGFAVSRRSSWGTQGPASSDVPTLWLGDSLGEMALYFGLTDAALLGGSFEPLGGQNLIEAAACGCPVVMGPHTFNFAQASEQAQEAGAALRVADLAEGVALAAQLVLDEQRLAQARQACGHFSQSHRGAAQRLARAIVHVMNASVAGLVRTG